MTYSIQLSDGSEDPVWDQFLVDAPMGSHVQSSVWGLLKQTLNMSVARVVVLNNGSILGGAQVLIRSISTLGAIGYVARGPVLLQTNSDVLEAIFKGLLRIARRHRIRMMILQLPDNMPALTQSLSREGFLTTGIEVAPTATVQVDLRPPLETIFSNLKPSARKYIRKGQRRGLSGRIAEIEEIPVFYRLMMDTCNRQGFCPFPFSYYKAMWRILAPKGYLKLVVVEFDNEPVSAQMVITFGDTLITKNKGWSGAYKQLGPNYVMDWTTMVWARENGYRIYDFEGIDLGNARSILSGRMSAHQVSYGPTRYKLQFGGQIKLFPLSLATVFNPLLRWGYQHIFTKVQNTPAVRNLIQRLRAG